MPAVPLVFCLFDTSVSMYREVKIMPIDVIILKININVTLILMISLYMCRRIKNK